MSIEFECLDEPTLEFGQHFQHQDTKTGLAQFGPFGKSVTGLHQSEIKLGFIGTRESIDAAKAWIVQCGHRIESPRISQVAGVSEQVGTLFSSSDERAKLYRAEKILRPDFIGFSRDTSFDCEFQMNDRWDRLIDSRELERHLALPSTRERIERIVELIEENIKGLAANSPSPDIIVVALTKQVTDKAFTAQISGTYFLDLRRSLKARAMQWGIPIQILTHRMLDGSGDGLQDPATRAWNFCTAQYYKAQGVPWRPSSIDPNTCFIGISFYVAQEASGHTSMRSSVAQAFDYLGQGLVLRGDPFEWRESELGRSPHLTREAACSLVSRTLEEYRRVQGIPPRRIVIHKSSEYWGPEKGRYNERDGFYEGIDSVFQGLEIDMLSIRQTGVNVHREGKYPPLRGTYFRLEDQHFIFTMGYIPYLQTYPGVRVPEPWQITDYHGGGSQREILREVLALTKMNVNNCSFADGTPITLLFARKIGEIMKHVPETGVIHPHYRFYM